MPDHYYVEDFEDGTLTSSSTGRIDRHPLRADTLTCSTRGATRWDTNIVPAVFNWQTGGDFRLGYSEDGPTALQKEQTPAAITASGVRRLTPRECERLQGFPDDWTLIPGASDSKRYAALGDAVTVPVAEWIGRRLAEVAA